MYTNFSIQNKVQKTSAQLIAVVAAYVHSFVWSVVKTPCYFSIINIYIYTHTYIHIHMHTYIPATGAPRR